MTVVLQDVPFDAARVLADFQAKQRTAGAVVTFSGIVRDTEAGLTAMEIEHYPGMTETELERIADHRRRPGGEQGQIHLRIGDPGCGHLRADLIRVW